MNVEEFLAIVKKIIAKQNAAIYAQSTEGEGIMFIFLLLEEKIEE
jgi:signal transduction histidine kinase